jgi:hypothetical protein
MEVGDVKMFFIAGNPCVTGPDRARISKAIKGLDGQIQRV